MTKHKYNQGDLLRFHWTKADGAHMLVILGVFSNSYEVLWPDQKGARKPIKSYYFDTLDNNDNITLVARG